MPIFVVDTKLIFNLNFVAPLKASKVYNFLTNFIISLNGTLATVQYPTEEIQEIHFF